ncbi:hypothetical protein ACVIHI_000492 [Bradyrhizobium sp. USDA 4524]|uniref:phosphatase PAP2 family protein n=1 Tax=unclassified Bradyrhizobium TaxID=2631580 RepID=UPI002811EDC7|nr:MULTISPECIES: phosphatase PAP2 family protein [unclassified Bradyrhizobium]MCP1838137.1 undecaprenyl-diphosphatase [Bradyrhizobium sp. USDA 4538]MCP1898702.1 undecaprenyl-diphosphatase [Bradyrhizobium sp. USDA 4537]MCP1987187.1 undecaprenyl-diphosphatase [Bradyrhizobium sp. USDA 4539]
MARALTWGADEKLLLVLTAVGWLASRGCGVPLRRAGNHALPVTVTASLLPRDLKLVFDQTRPDPDGDWACAWRPAFRQTKRCVSLRPRAAHGLAPAASGLPAGPRRAIRAIAVGLSLTRIAILAHWASDVVAGFALGAILERVLRLWTGYSNGISKEDDHADS